jgi:hypothetical protein
VSACLLAPWRVGAEQTKQCASCEAAYVGAWSPVVNGLRARLVLEPDVQWEAREKSRFEEAKKYGMKWIPDPYAKDHFLRYLDLENLTGAWIDLGYSAEESFRCNLTDVSGHEAEEIPVTILAPFMISIWITVPGNSMLHLFVRREGYSSDTNGMVVGAGDRLWRVASDRSARYYLGGTFSESKPLTPAPKGTWVWKGKLILPKVELPLPSE